MIAGGPQAEAELEGLGGAGCAARGVAPSAPGRAHQVPDAQQDGAGADMAAQAAAVRVEPRPGRDHLHRSDARTSLQEPRPLGSWPRCPGRLLLPLSLAAPTPHPFARPLAPRCPESSERRLRRDTELEDRGDARGRGRRGLGHVACRGS